MYIYVLVENNRAYVSLYLIWHTNFHTICLFHSACTLEIILFRIQKSTIFILATLLFHIVGISHLIQSLFKISSNQRQCYNKHPCRCLNVCIHLKVFSKLVISLSKMVVHTYTPINCVQSICLAPLHHPFILSNFNFAKLSNVKGIRILLMF